MNRIIILPVLAIFVLACSAEPEPLHFGKDNCYTCKMTLMDRKFGAEVVTKKGKVYKFDDINCMINFNNSGYEPESNVAYRLVVDFSKPGTLIKAEDAFYVKSEQIKSPMASEVAAFEKKENMKTSNNEWHGIYLTWGELVTQFK